HLIREIIGWARDIKAMSNEERNAFLADTSAVLPARSRSHKQSFSLKMALWLEPSMSDEVEETLADPEIERNRGDWVDSLDRLVELINEDMRRVPVVIIDDSDRWLRLESNDRDNLLNAFFSDTCRMLAERNWAVVMAIHPEYCAAGSFREALQNGWF